MRNFYDFPVFKKQSENQILFEILFLKNLITKQNNLRSNQSESNKRNTHDTESFLMFLMFDNLQVLNYDISYFSTNKNT